MPQIMGSFDTKSTAGEVREKWSEFLFYLSVFFGALHLGAIVSPPLL
ncbi:MAG: hypothetical protein ABII64_08340 [Elusimicrobiota bacterium]